MKKANQEMYHGIKQASVLTGIPIEILTRARQHPDCPDTVKGGFAASGRVYMTPLFIQWIEKHWKELNHVEPGTLEYWKLQRTKSQALMAERRLAERQGKFINKKDVIELLQRMQSAQQALLSDKLRQPLIDKLQLTADKVTDLDNVIGEINGVFSKQVEQWRK